MSSPWVSRLRHASTIASAVVVLAVLCAIACRITFPLELEWMEGGLLHQAQRLQRGLPIYPPPGPDFVPFLYTPLYPTVLAALGSVVGLDYAVGRLVSVLACLAIALAIARAVHHEGKPRAHLVAAIGLFASGYVFTFRWYDVARPDMLYLALVLWGLVFLHEAGRDGRAEHRKALLGGVLMGLGFLTKQTAAPFAAMGGIAALVLAPRCVPAYAAGLVAVAGGGVAVGNALTDGWLWTYVYELHQSHAFNRERFTTKTWGMFVHAAPFVVVLVGFIVGGAMARTARRGGGPLRDRLLAQRGTLFWGFAAACGLLVSALGYATQWAEPNAFIPGVVMGAVWVGVGLPTGGRAEATALGLVILQIGFSLLIEPFYQPIQDRGVRALGRSYRVQDPFRTIPTAKARADAAALRQALEQGEGRVFALHRPWWSVLAGGDGHVGAMGLNDVPEADRKAIQAALRDRITAGEYRSIWTEGDPPAWLRPALTGHRVERRLHGRDRVRPLSGYMSEAGMVTPYRNDQVLMVPIADRPLPPGARVVADFEDGSMHAFALEGGAFRRPVRGWQGRLPPVGPYGGALLLSSAGIRASLELEGVAHSPAFTVARGECVELLIGTSGEARGLSAEIVSTGDEPTAVTIPLSGDPFVLVPVRVQVPPGEYQLRLEDASVHAAMFVDDLRLIACGDATAPSP